MRAKFYYVALEPEAQELADEMERSLTEIAIAFGHSFLMKPVSLEDILAIADDENTVPMLLNTEGTRPAGVDCFAVKRSFLYEACRCDVYCPTQKNDAVQQQLFDYAARNLLPAPVISDEDGARRIASLIRSPEKVPISVCGYTAGVYLQAAAMSLMGNEPLIFETLIGKRRPILSVSKSAMPLYAHYYALAEGLETLLNLHREANCLRTTVRNVCSAGWRTKPSNEEQVQVGTVKEICALINEQLSLVGEMMNHDMIR